jgi:hypothetical protein
MALLSMHRILAHVTMSARARPQAEMSVSSCIRAIKLSAKFSHWATDASARQIGEWIHADDRADPVSLAWLAASSGRTVSVAALLCGRTVQ